MKKIDTADWIDRIFSRYKLKKTYPRIILIKLLRKKGRALSGKEVCKNMERVADDSTTYRNLKHFAQLGIVNYFYGTQGLSYYELKGNIGDTDKADQHWHFSCTLCHKSSCFDIPRLNFNAIPQGFLISKTYFLSEGLCSDCQAQSKIQRVIEISGQKFIKN